MNSSDKPSEKQTRTKIPVGILALLAFILIELFFMFQLFIQGVSLPVGPVILSGAFARIYIFLSIVLLVALCVGFVNRRTWARILGIVWYAYDILLALVNVVVFNRSPHMFVDMYQQYKPSTIPVLTEDFISQVLLINTVFMLVCGGIIIAYLYNSRKYFSKD